MTVLRSSSLSLECWCCFVAVRNMTQRADEQMSSASLGHRTIVLMELRRSPHLPVLLLPSSSTPPLHPFFGTTAAKLSMSFPVSCQASQHLAHTFFHSRAHFNCITLHFSVNHSPPSHSCCYTYFFCVVECSAMFLFSHLSLCANCSVVLFLSPPHCSEG